MKMVVDGLPYYYGYCPFDEKVNRLSCPDAGTSRCPRYWSKDFVCSDENPHECEMLVEIGVFKAKER